MSPRAAPLAALIASEEGGDPARAAYLGMWHDSQETRIGDIPHSAKPYLEVASNERITEDQVAVLPESAAKSIRDAVSELAVCEAWWDDTLRSYPRQPRVYEVLSFLVTTPVPLTTWLAAWDAQPPGPADLHAQDLCGWWLPDLLSDELTVGWVEQTDITAEIKRWVLESAKPRLARVPLDPDLTLRLHLLEQGY
ncbi:hypothetical protein ACIBL3_34460 [Kribbella sp. NPDC050124]|uniref:hypothetical protein n=1 Tax=Kribbella sp. NPDC050124 TaxID=3364114 RepID=UPI00379AE856